MFIDTRTVEHNTVIETTVCIIGGGVAGITLALEMSRAGVDTCMLESGGFGPDDETRDLYRGENAGLPYSFADGSRSRYFGGSSNCWGGWCRPLDPWDFDKRDWIPHSGWPFGLDELAPYYARTHELLKLGPQNFDPAYWEREIGRHDVRRIPLATGDMRDTVAQFSPPVRFGKAYRDELSRSARVRVFLHANVQNIDADAEGTSVARLQVATISGRKMTVTARIFVLATGGIENARLLLASNNVQAAGLGNANDLVGRYFMDHPRMMSGKVRFRPGNARNKLYDIKYHYQNAAVSAHGTKISSQFAPKQELMEREKLLNSRVWLYSRWYGEGTAGSEALIHCKEALLQKDQPGRSLKTDVATMIAHPLHTVGYGLTRLLQWPALITDVTLQAIVEAVPDPDSRVTLSADKRDRFGMPRVKVEWRLGEQVQRTFDKTFALLAQELQMAGIADVELDAPLEGRSWPAKLEGTWHHMGTTRMHDSPREGVVDRDCKVHGMSNFYVAGSSVFPTVGANFPTITIAALALRLAGHLVRQLDVPDIVGDTRGDAANSSLISIQTQQPQVETLPIAASTLTPLMKEQ
ncbi:MULTISPECIES: FAD-dependent oxidoreductase [Paraburkholderia]|uniref:GMC family oxidoreductase n=1 Tax=Paraburkholderia madseniana TaxID=2599607 RepID=A0AAP5EZS2_9BURK|nr:MULTISPECIES: GMC family oxidoreductase [Paraburkholderia]MCX4149894.1 GMC family oxidoreductase [Paraburkholderia madseniana]MDN7152830.1 GMC family oxidoreductase [Paraburkholderia sp. WS6]MDQ6411712.1 GMC family oxidoreductase [Paraburkholderia madseniana]NPT66561.1 FAD-dependent oxidoreductase [Paraburkholderia madseniana]